MHASMHTCKHVCMHAHIQVTCILLPANGLMSFCSVITFSNSTCCRVQNAVQVMPELRAATRDCAEAPWPARCGVSEA